MTSLVITDSISEALIIGSALIAIVFGLINALIILRIKVFDRDEAVMALKDDKMVQKYQTM